MIMLTSWKPHAETIFSWLPETNDRVCDWLLHMRHFQVDSFQDGWLWEAVLRSCINPNPRWLHFHLTLVDIISALNNASICWNELTFNTNSMLIYFWCHTFFSALFFVDSLPTSLIQAQLGCIPIQEFGLTQDTGKIFRSGIRLSKCNLPLLKLQCDHHVFSNYPNNVFLIASVCQCRINRPPWSSVLAAWCFVCPVPGLVEFLTQHSKKNFSAQLNAVILAKCFRAKLWEDSPYISKQLDRIGEIISWTL